MRRLALTAALLLPQLAAAGTNATLWISAGTTNGIASSYDLVTSAPATGNSGAFACVTSSTPYRTYYSTATATGSVTITGGTWSATFIGDESNAACNNGYTAAFYKRTGTTDTLICTATSGEFGTANNASTATCTGSASIVSGDRIRVDWTTVPVGTGGTSRTLTLFWGTADPSRIDLPQCIPGITDTCSTPVTGVTVSPTSASVVGGTGTQAVTATIAPADATNQALTWSLTEGSSCGTLSSTSTNPTTFTAATQSSYPATCHVVATTSDGGYTATSTITVNDPSLPVITGLGVANIVDTTGPATASSITASAGETLFATWIDRNGSGATASIASSPTLTWTSVHDNGNGTRTWKSTLAGSFSGSVTVTFGASTKGLLSVYKVSATSGTGTGVTATGDGTLPSTSLTSGTNGSILVFVGFSAAYIGSGLAGTNLTAIHSLDATDNQFWVMRYDGNPTAGTYALGLTSPTPYGAWDTSAFEILKSAPSGQVTFALNAASGTGAATALSPTGAATFAVNAAAGTGAAVALAPSGKGAVGLAPATGTAGAQALTPAGRASVALSVATGAGNATALAPAGKASVALWPAAGTGAAIALTPTGRAAVALAAATGDALAGSPAIATKVSFAVTAAVGTGDALALTPSVPIAFALAAAEGDAGTGSLAPSGRATFALLPAAGAGAATALAPTGRGAVALAAASGTGAATAVMPTGRSSVALSPAEGTGGALALSPVGKATLAVTPAGGAGGAIAISPTGRSTVPLSSAVGTATSTVVSAAGRSTLVVGPAAGQGALGELAITTNSGPAPVTFNLAAAGGAAAAAALVPAGRSTAALEASVGSGVATGLDPTGRASTALAEAAGTALAAALAPGGRATLAIAHAVGEAAAAMLDPTGRSNVTLDPARGDGVAALLSNIAVGAVTGVARVLLRAELYRPALRASLYTPRLRAALYHSLLDAELFRPGLDATLYRPILRTRIIHKEP